MRWGEPTRRSWPARRNLPQLSRLLLHPEQEHGNIVQVTGRLRRITRVVVDEPDIRQRFGIAAYYQLDVMVPVGDQPIEVRGEHGEQAGPVYRESFPFTCCTVATPGILGIAGRSPESQSTGVDERRVLQALGLQQSAAWPPTTRGSASSVPMFVVGAPQAWDLSSRSRPGPGLLVGLGFGGLLVIVWVAVWAHESVRSKARPEHGAATRAARPATAVRQPVNGTAARSRFRRFPT